jgi:protein NrfD
MPDTAQWDGRTYYGRPQLKSAPFNAVLVGSYVFLAGLSGAAQVLATALDRAAISGAEPTVRRGRLLSLLAPTIGTVCLIFDLHTPKRFYNMLRLVKATSPMSLGSWALVAFSGASVAIAAPLVGPTGWQSSSPPSSHRTACSSLLACAIQFRHAISRVSPCRSAFFSLHGCCLGMRRLCLRLPP